MRHYFCHGHGEITSDGLGLIEAGGENKFMIYTPDGMAISDGYAEDVQKKAADGVADMDAWVTHWRDHTKVVLRSKTPPQTKIPTNCKNIAKERPKAFNVSFNYHLTGEGDFQFSGVYDASGKQVLALADGETISLKEIYDQLLALAKPESICVHWLACASDHVGKKPSLECSGFKVDVA